MMNQIKMQIILLPNKIMKNREKKKKMKKKKKKIRVKMEVEVGVIQDLEVKVGHIQVVVGQVQTLVTNLVKENQF